ncbi:hypothetical protein J2R78_001142 [Bradyrhizobium sp. USDA 4538]|nr:hypothetical protein [Bradyrhizobium sp. USDA 4538]ODM76432.1 hypothetical protein A6452_35315 [Bradyrhizobium elkanii]ODM83748.1 hypothetical protein A6X20_13825 [Bradyrhizobium elkanii]
MQDGPDQFDQKRKTASQPPIPIFARTSSNAFAKSTEATISAIETARGVCDIGLQLFPRLDKRWRPDCLEGD